MKKHMKKLLYFILYRILGSILLDLLQGKELERAAPAPRRRLCDVKPGETITIEWYKILGRIGDLQVLNNDPETKKILLEVHWRNTSIKEKIILGYESPELRNFHLLNSYEKKEEEEENGEGDEGGEHDIAELQKKINKAIEEEDYETAEKLQKKIDQLLK